MICVARANHDVAIMAARSRQNHLSLLFISGLPGADWLTSSELVLSDPRLSLAGQRPIVSARSARGGLRACWIQVGRIPDSCFSLSNAPGFFAPCPTGDEPRFIGLFAGGYLRWWDWPDENWSPSLTLAVRSPSLVAETN